MEHNNFDGMEYIEFAQRQVTVIFKNTPGATDLVEVLHSEYYIVEINAHIDSIPLIEQISPFVSISETPIDTTMSRYTIIVDKI